jgi:pimeloyl-ACP methyl ester carboxylesterase
MKTRYLALLALPIAIITLTLFGCGKPETRTLPEAKKGFVTKLATQHLAGEPVEVPPPGVFSVVQYPTKKGNFPAYLTPPIDNQRRPAMIWITGGDCNTIGEVWDEPDPANDQSASAFRKAGMVMMFPSLRGGNQNPGPAEGFLGEVDDILAAADFLAKQPHVDPKRIYLGGHSTGGTMAMLVAESSPKFRAVFAFGPVGDIEHYGGDFAYNEPTSEEFYVRAPGNWLHSIQSPTFVIEGSDSGNASDVRQMKRANKNPKGHFYVVDGYSHFSVLSPVNKFLVKKIIADNGAPGSLKITDDEISAL